VGLKGRPAKSGDFLKMPSSPDFRKSSAFETVIFRQGWESYLADGNEPVEHRESRGDTEVDTTSIKRVALAGIASVALAGASLGVASAQQQSGVAANPNAVYQQTPQGPGGRPGPNDPNGNRQPPSAEQIQQMQHRREQEEQAYVNALAKNLNLDPSTVKSALDQTRKDMQAQRISDIQQAVTDGKLSQDQANQMIQRIQNGGQDGRGFGGPGFGPGHGPDGGRGGRGPGMGPGGPQGN
jgi:hypothetical protein